MATLIAAALLIWGFVAGLPIVAVPDARIEAAAANRYAGHCEIAYNPAWWGTLDAQQRQNVIIHETGHCIGILGHLPPNQVGAMSGLSGGQPFSGYDRLLFWHVIRPAPYRLTLALVGRAE